MPLDNLLLNLLPRARFNRRLYLANARRDPASVLPTESTVVLESPRTPSSRNKDSRRARARFPSRASRSVLTGSRVRRARSHETARTRLPTMNSGALVFVGIAPHPPVMVPEVGGASAEEVRDSIEAMRDMTQRINACGAETVVLISPHAPLEERAFVAYGGPRLRGDFANFRAPRATVDVPLDAELLVAIEEAAGEEGFRVTRLKARA